MKMGRKREARLFPVTMSFKFQYQPKVEFLSPIIYQTTPLFSFVHLVNIHILPEIISLDLDLSLTYAYRFC